MPFGPVVQKRTPTLFAGRLRHKIDIVQLSSVQDSTGGQSTSAVTIYANVWASIEALSGTEKFAAHEFVSQVSHQVVIRWIGPAPSWQADYNYVGKQLVIDAFRNLQQAQSGGGTSGDTAPAWNRTVGGLTDDGPSSTGVVWKNVGPANQRSGVSAAMQIVFQGRIFQVEAVLNPDERNKMQILLCVEINDSNQQSPNVPSGDLN